MNTKENLTKHLKERTKVLKSKSVEEAFRNIDRKLFIHKDYYPEAYEDYPLPIGEGQTISQPTVVAFMLELLELEKGQKILDVGSGSGWTLALICDIVGKGGEVYGLERQPNLVKFGRSNLSKFNFKNAKIFQTEKGVLGCPERGPYDRILISASYDEIPQDLLNQLKAGGIMVAPVRSSICKIVKKSENEIEKEEYEGFDFVPLIK